MKLFYAPQTCSLASLIVLHDVNADFEIEMIDFSSAAQNTDSYRRINPKLRVPALESENTVLTETPAILAYLAQTYPKSGLIPADTMQFAQIQSFNVYLCSTLHVAHAHRTRGYRWVDGDDHILAMQKKVPEVVGSCYEYIETYALWGPYVFGENYTIADPYLFTLSQWMEADGVSRERFPNIARHSRLMSQRSCVLKSLIYETDI